MPLERPDLSEVSPEILAYIESLEAELAARTPRRGRASIEAAPEPEPDAEPELCEPPTSVNLITLSVAGMIKRTPRHLYGRQRRGGMGIFDLDTPETAPPVVLALADESATLLLFSDQGRSYRLPVNRLAESPIRARGVFLTELLTLRPDERIVAVLPDVGGDQVALVGARGWVAAAPASFVGKSMIPGVAYFDAKERGPLAAACWVSNDDDVLIASRTGLAIRFPVKRVSKSGCLGIRLEKGDTVVGAAPATDESAVFLVGADGKGTLRLMSGFQSNKSPGGGGKVALKTDHLTGVVAASEDDDLFIISRNSKLIRFRAAEVPPKEGVVQGVNCMALRGDETTATAAAKLAG
jgi:DNA gyrase subunit A